ncbi:ATP-dependent RNA helicase HrpA [Gryllotalpicola ginsengisoli]|uniref:ATP-dependent RNA helicase HrpA n=1 Tax=Gryllotalpicola ginsengisoli TaxID=444608 RepID=UPI0003B651EA|nr:ATP-dependent RNA helicase HrpA [Gryllotalpicola ginsengisoli]
MPDTPQLPRITFPEDLPVSRKRDEIAEAIANHQVVIVAGETGSGKTTQLPKIALQLGRERIGHTQPRRLAARTIAERIAEELGEPLGQTVGYKVRFTDQVSAATRIKLMTDGILLNEMHRDRDLAAYDTIIIDEAHERSLNIDFLLGYLAQLLPRRPDLKLIITSATIDPESFAKHFADASGRPAPIVEVSGRTYPVEIRYRPLVAEEVEDEDVDAGLHSPAAPASRPAGGGTDRDVNQGIIDALDELAREKPGDVLVFLSGENEIRDAADAIRGHLTRRGQADTTDVLPLYGRLSAAEQHRVFEPSSRPGIRRRVVLATNVAETSLTVPGIKYVIDAGQARISRYSTRAKVQRLPIEAISQASATQRSGRAGRTSDGIAIRLYSQEDFEKRPAFTEPEILRTNLAAVILQMISLGLGDIEAFPFLTKPDPRGVKDGLDLLTELGAVSRRASGAPQPAGGRASGAPQPAGGRASGAPQPAGGRARGLHSPASPTSRAAGARGQSELRLTRIGRDLARLPIDPRFARMVIESRKHGTTREVMAIVAGLTIQDPRERPVDRRGTADQLHARFADPTSDFLTLLNLWNHLEEKQRELSSSAFRRLCKAEFLNYLRVREWQDVYRQLTRMARELKLEVGEPAVNPDGIHKSLLAGLLSHLGLRDQAKRDYAGARGTRFVIFPGSTLAKKQPPAVMSAELVETSRLFARMNAAIDPAWAEPIAGDLVKRQYSEPHWEKNQGAAVAYEKVTLFGVPIVERRRVQFARIDRDYARTLFLRHGLVDCEWPTERKGPLFEFDRRNRALVRRLQQLEERTRRRDILDGDEAVFAFYDERVPRDVVDTRSFERWWREARTEHPKLLTMTERMLLADASPEELVDHDAFPTIWRQGDQRFQLSYRFEPGAEDDGVTVTVPLPLLARLGPAGFDWQVPGLRTELVTALIRSLPKALRRSVVPAADWAAKIVAELPEEPNAPLTEAVASVIKRLTYAPVDADDFDLERVPAHLRPTFAVIDERGKRLGRSKDLAELQRRFATRARDSVAAVATARVPNALERDEVPEWDMRELPRQVDTTVGGLKNTVRGYPALVDERGKVALRILATPAEQARQHPRGVRRMLLNEIPSPASYVQEHLTAPEKLALAVAPYASTPALFADCLAAVVDEVLAADATHGLVFTKADYERVRDRVSAVVVDAMFDTVKHVARTLTAARKAEKAVAAATSMALLAALTDMKQQLANLVYPGFVSATGRAQLKHLPRYLEGIAYRAEKLPDNPGRDRAWMTEVQTATARYAEAGGTLPLDPHAPEKLRHTRWMLEELRISLFAQPLGTAESVSLQRIAKVLAA